MAEFIANAGDASWTSVLRRMAKIEDRLATVEKELKECKQEKLPNNGNDFGTTSTDQSAE